MKISVVLATLGLALATGCATGAESSSGPAAEPPAESITIAAVGDIIMGNAPDQLPPDNARGFFDKVTDPLRADLTMGNIEQALSDPTDYTKCPPPKAGEKVTCRVFRTPPSFAGALRAGGFHVLNVANNHTNDAGPRGRRNTRDALTAAGMRPTGGPEEIAIYKTHGVKVAVLGFGPYSGMPNINDLPGAAALVRAAAAKADLVVVTMHIGAEGANAQHIKPGTERYVGEDRGDPIKFSRTVVDAGADLVVGHGPHVLRAMEFYKGRLIAYSMGNFAGYKVFDIEYPTSVGGVLRATLRRDGSWETGSLVGTELTKTGLPAPETKGRARALVRELSAADLGASAVRVAEDGTLSPAPVQ